jgi:hypothetical protein
MSTTTMSPTEAELSGFEPITHDYSFNVTNSGGYMAVFNVTYRIGNTIYDKESAHFGAGSSQEIPVPQDARDITLKVDLFTFFWARKMIFSLKFPHPVKKCFNLWGSVTDPKWADVNCGG